MAKHSQITIDDGGPTVEVTIEFFGDLFGAYHYMLWSATSNSWVDERNGNNDNPQDDTYALPVPVSSNHKRLIEFNCRMVGKNSATNPGYKIVCTATQGGRKLGVSEASGTLTEDAKIELLSIKIL